MNLVEKSSKSRDFWEVRLDMNVNGAIIWTLPSSRLDVNVDVVYERPHINEEV